MTPFRLARRRGLRMLPALVPAWVPTLLTVSMLAQPAAAADTVPDPLAAAVRAVVEAQLRAMASGDDERAFSYAAPGIRAQFGDAARFMAMVRGSYPMVVGPRSTAFFRPQADDGAVLQQVQLRDSAGRLWRATYRLERQADGRWQIAGCVVAAEAAGATT